jgi:hypothetical protein
MSGKFRQVVGLGLLLVVAGVVLVWQRQGGDWGAQRPDPITVRGTIGSEKAGLLDDPDVKKILLNKYGITVDYRRTGSIVLATGDVAGQDFLWPGSQFARELYEQTHPPARSEVIFNSPIVMYAWNPVADGLVKQGTVEVVDGVRYLDLPALITMIEAGKTWREVGVPQLTGRVLVATTDPTKSNSGNLFAGLLANTYNGGNVPDASTAQTMLPRLREFYGRLGYMEDSTGFLFNQFLVMGVGTYPLIVGYENQLVEYSIEHEAQRDLLKREIVLLYPRPTVWSSHTLIAVTPAGGKLLDALKNPDIQQLAWSKHGFRSGLMGVQNDPKVLQVVGVSNAEVAAIPIPQASVMELITQGLQTSAAGPAPSPTPRPR